MGLERQLDISFYDLSLIRGIWEVRVKKHRQKQKKEKERVEKSALTKINQQWQYRIHCKSLKSSEKELLHHYLERSALTQHTGINHLSVRPPCTGCGECQDEQSTLVFRLDGDQWAELPAELQWMTYLREWHIRYTRIRLLPEYLAHFSQLTVLQMPHNALSELPPEIGKLSSLKELNVNYNHLCKVPAELGHCENLERLELTGNCDLSQLPFELSGLKKLVHLDIAENTFVSIPICTLRMSSLQLLDMSNNLLTDLPQDMDRLEQLHSLFIHKNCLSYLPHCLVSISTLKVIVVSGDELVCIPTRLCSNPDIKFIRLYDKPVSEERRKREEEEKKKKKEKSKRKEKREDVRSGGREKEFIQAYIESLKDRESIPYSTTKVSISCLL
ncbi:leucine-rich repeat-containing protein 2 [Lampris incognitus]|uniref:leucine-rich repeat-containing protein 2 n=1 Tax=Lampris incognitus TaxID=2546036 RepID=UPI0024B59C70|nr:leucine-rich repeat-containing protein 2 [Lampris incognitus]